MNDVNKALGMLYSAFKVANEETINQMKLSNNQTSYISDIGWDGFDKFMNNRVVNKLKTVSEYDIKDPVSMLPDLREIVKFSVEYLFVLQPNFAFGEKWRQESFVEHYMRYYDSRIEVAKGALTTLWASRNS